MHDLERPRRHCLIKNRARSVVGSGLRRRPIQYDRMRRAHSLSTSDRNPPNLPSSSSSVGSTSPIGGSNPFSPSGMDSAEESTEASFQSQDSTRSDVLRLTVLHEKHMLLVSLMEWYYDGTLTACTDNTTTGGSSSQQTLCSSQSTKSEGQAMNTNNPARGRKRHNEEDDDSPEKDRRGKRDKKGPGSGNKHANGRLFACPFYKFDPLTHCINSIHGAKYRTCAGPGFKQLSHVR